MASGRVQTPSLDQLLGLGLGAGSHPVEQSPLPRWLGTAPHSGAGVHVRNSQQRRPAPASGAQGRGLRPLTPAGASLAASTPLLVDPAALHRQQARPAGREELPGSRVRRGPAPAPFEQPASVASRVPHDRRRIESLIAAAAGVGLSTEESGSEVDALLSDAALCASLVASGGRPRQQEVQYSWIGHHRDVAFHTGTGHLVKLLTPRRAAEEMRTLQQRMARLKLEESVADGVISQDNAAVLEGMSLTLDLGNMAEAEGGSPQAPGHAADCCRGGSSTAPTTASSGSSKESSPVTACESSAMLGHSRADGPCSEAVGVRWADGIGIDLRSIGQHSQVQPDLGRNGTSQARIRRKANRGVAPHRVLYTHSPS